MAGGCGSSGGASCFVSDGSGTTKVPGSALGTLSSHGPLDAVDDSIPRWSCIAEVNPVEVWVFKEKH